jgi:hypothetical protein
MAKTKRKPYAERSDVEKIESQWKKIKGLHTDRQASAAIVRAGTAAELAANFSIRREFKKRSDFDDAFVDKLLRWANGLDGKVNRLLIPLFAGKSQEGIVRGLKAVAERINRDRNAIVHQGEFRNRKKAAAIIKDTRHFVETLIGIYRANFRLTKIDLRT